MLRAKIKPSFHPPVPVSKYQCMLEASPYTRVLWEAYTNTRATKELVAFINFSLLQK